MKKKLTILSTTIYHL